MALQDSPDLFYLNRLVAGAHSLLYRRRTFTLRRLITFLFADVPAEVRARLAQLGADVRLEPSGQPMREKLAWRFKVANDPSVGRFLVRDVDSVIGEREKAAVDAWLASDKWFHVMRDWWTHTDLILAGRETRNAVVYFNRK